MGCWSTDIVLGCDCNLDELIDLGPRKFVNNSERAFDNFLADENCRVYDNISFLYSVLIAYGTGYTKLPIKQLFGFSDSKVNKACRVSKDYTWRLRKELILKAEDSLYLLIKHREYKVGSNAYNVCSHCIGAIEKYVSERKDFDDSKYFLEGKYRLLRNSMVTSSLDGLDLYNRNINISDILKRSKSLGQYVYLLKYHSNKGFVMPFYLDIPLAFNKFNRVRESVSSILEDAIVHMYDSYPTFIDSWWGNSRLNTEYLYRYMFDANRNPYSKNKDINEVYNDFESPYNYKSKVSINPSDFEKKFFDRISRTGNNVNKRGSYDYNRKVGGLLHKLGSNLFLDRWDISPVIRLEDVGNLIKISFMYDNGPYYQCHFEIYMDKDGFFNGIYDIVNIKDRYMLVKEGHFERVVENHTKDLNCICNFLRHVVDTAYSRHNDLEFECVMLYCFADKNACGVSHYLSSVFCDETTEDFTHSYYDGKLHCSYIVSLQ